MLRRLRLHLTGLYVLVALGLVAMLGAGAYSLLGYYFLRETDMALSFKMAQAYRQFNVQPPLEIRAAEQKWQSEQLAALSASPTAARLAEDGESREDGDDRGGGAETGGPADYETDERYDARLASIYILRIDAQGRTILVPGSIPPPYSLDLAAVNAARASGSDLRIVRLPTGERLRLLTYPIESSIGPFFIQAGRSLADQDRVRTRFLVGLLGLSLLAAALFGAGSWWLSGESLLPAQRSWDQQQTFIANASHELRTPLTLIKASAEVIERTRPPAGEQAELMAGILTEVDYMDRLIDDLLLLSRLDTHRLALSRTPVALADLLAEAGAQARRLAGEGGPSVECGPAAGVVLADAQRLRQVLLILLDNAIRHTPPGGAVRLEACSGKPAAGRPTYRILVSDNGSGIPAKDLPHVFERFYQATPAVNPDLPAKGAGPLRTNGLGLSIARGIVEALDGHISLTSQVGHGTNVIIELPAAASVH